MRSALARVALAVAAGALTTLAQAAEARVEWRARVVTPVGAPPVLHDGRLFVVDGALSAREATSGRGLWRAPLGEFVPSCLVAHAGRVIVAAERIVAFDAASGLERWRFEPRANTSLACPTIAAGRLLTGTSGGEVIALDLRDEVAADERLRWSTRIGSETFAAPAVVRGVTIEGDVAYVAAEQWRVANGHTVVGWIAALDVSSGRLIWQSAFGAAHERRAASASPRVTSTGVVVVPDALGNSLVAVDARDGSVRWEFRGARDSAGFAATPHFARGTLYAASGDASLYALRADTGALAWRRALPAGGISTTECGGRLFVEYQGLAIIDPADGRLLARQLEDDGDFVSSGFAVDGTSLFTAGPRAVYRLDCGHD